MLFNHHTMHSDHNTIETLVEQAITQHQQGNLENACLLYLDALDMAGESPLVHFNLGLALYELERYEESCEYYLNALEYAPEEPDILYNLALSLKRLEKYDEAMALFKRILEKDPLDVDTLYNLACCCTDTLDDQKAIHYYRQALEIDDTNQSAINNLAYVYHRTGDYTNASRYYRRLLELDPHNRSARHMLDSLQGTPRQKAPTCYIKEVFDDYSEHFEENLLSQLEYTVPSRLRECFDATYPFPKKQYGLDLGCGTGLCGEAFADICRWMTGVDISAKMVEVARSKNIYSELKTEELEKYLQECTARFDLVVAADVFNYVGDLSNVIAGVAAVSAAGGRFCFSIEESHHQEFCLQKTGRFAHSREYVSALLEENGWRIDYQVRADLRRDGSHWVTGRLYFATRDSEGYLLEERTSLDEPADKQARGHGQETK